MPESIFRRISEGDRTAVRECIARHGGLVWSLARRFCGAESDAEDAVQEIFIDLWTHAGRYDPTIASETTFVAMIARRKLIDRRRKQGRRPKPVSLPDDIPCRSKENPLERVDRLDEATRAARALEVLTDDQRQVLILSIYHGRTYDQIAEEIGKPLGTVKTHARRGLIRLRQSLDAGPPAVDLPLLPATPSTKGGNNA